MSEKISHQELIQRFPDLLKIEKSIRTHVLDVFSKTENGTPNNISKAGCLALALKSNEIGEVEKLHVVWNAWREVFAVRFNDNKPVNNAVFDQISFNKELNINLSFFDFGDFSSFFNSRWQGVVTIGARFGKFSNFNRSIFNDKTSFVGCVFGAKTEFIKTRWDSYSSIEGSEWHERVVLNGSIFGSNFNASNTRWFRQAQISGCHFGERANFEISEFGYGTNFTGSIFGVWSTFQCSKWDNFSILESTEWDWGANFNGAIFGSGVNFSFSKWLGWTQFCGCLFNRNIDFSGAEFYAETNFSGESWEELFRFYKKYTHAEKIFQNAKDFGILLGVSPDSFKELNFSGAIFRGTISFSNRHFTKETKFTPLPNGATRGSVDKDENGNIIFHSEDDHIPLIIQEESTSLSVSFSHPPSFFGCKFHQDTSFEDAIFPEPTGNEVAARAYGILKLSFSNLQSVREEQRFFRLEIAEETCRAKGWRKFWFLAYKDLSDFGFSVWLPILKLLLMPCLFFMLIYQLLLVVECPSLLHEPLIQHPERMAQWLTFSFSSAFPTPEFDVTKELRKDLYGSGLTYFVVLVLSSVQKVLSLFAVFLSGLALRNLFKLK